MKDVEIYELYHSVIGCTTPAANVLVQVSLYEHELDSMNAACTNLMISLTDKQKELFEEYLEAQTEIDTILELEAFRQGIVTAEKMLTENQNGGHSLKIESDR